MDKEFSEFANALLALRMGKPSNPLGYTTDDQGDNDTVGSEEGLFSQKGLTSNILAIPSSSWMSRDFAASYDFLENPTKQSRKRVHVTISATSSESNDAYDVDQGRGIVLDKKMSGKSSSGAEKKIARGRYRCSLCGAFKTNHVCALVTDKLMCSVGTQSYNSSSQLSLMPVSQPKGDSQQLSLPQSLSAEALATVCAHATALGLEAMSSSSSRTGEPVDYTLTVTGGSTAGKQVVNPFVASALPEVAGVFQERIVTVSRNRRSIQNPVPVPEEDVTVIMSTSDVSCDGSRILQLRKPFSSADEPAMTSSAASSPSNAVTPNSPFSFASKLESMATHIPGSALSMYPLLSVPVQPVSTLPCFPPMQKSAAPVATKAVPNLIYPSALDLLGHAIYD